MDGRISQQFGSVAMKLLELNSHHQIYQFTLTYTGVGVSCDDHTFKLTSQ